MSKELKPVFIQSVDQLRQFPIAGMNTQKPWNYRLAGGCTGVLMAPVLLLTGQGGYLKRLQDSEKEELRELLTIAGSDESWQKLNPLEQLDLRKRASVLTTRFTISKLYSFRR